MIFETICVGSLEVNCYILAEGEGQEAIIIDPGEDAERIKKVLQKRRLKPHCVINTHGHFDHIGADDKFDVPVYIHRKDVVLLRDPRLNLSGFFASGYTVKAQIKIMEEGQEISIGKIRLKVIHTPGHTPGGICLLLDSLQGNMLFSGDSLFYHGIGRTDFAGADEGVLINSIKEKLLTLADDTVVYPGHGASSTIGEERKNNPFLN